MQSPKLHIIPLLFVPGFATAAGIVSLGPNSAIGSASGAVAVSPDGRVVAGTVTSGSSSDVFRWTEGTGLEILSSPVRLGTSGMSADGDAIMGYTFGSSGSAPWRSYRWTADDGFVDIGQLSTTNCIGGLAPDTVAQGISGDGTVVFGTSHCRTGSFGNEVFRWSVDSGMTSIGLGNATAMSSDGGTVVGSIGGPTTAQAALWTSDTGWMGLGALAGYDETIATAVSPDGNVVVGFGYTSDALHRQWFRWTDDTGMVGIGGSECPYGSGSSPTGVTADGMTIVGNLCFLAYPSPNRATMWTAGNGMQDLLGFLTTAGATGIDGWQDLQVSAISPDGLWIVGAGTTPPPAQLRRAFLAGLGDGQLPTVVPIPAAVWLFGSALGLMGVARRKISS